MTARPRCSARSAPTFVRLDLWEEGAGLFEHEGAKARAIVIEAGERPDLAIAALRAVRKTDELASTPAIIAVPSRQVARVDPASGFDDFIVTPCTSTELYARIRQLEWRRSEFSTEERVKIGPLVIDRAAHEVLVEGRTILLTAKEFRAPRVPRAKPRACVLARDPARPRVGRPATKASAHGRHPRPAPPDELGTRSRSRPCAARLQLRTPT